MGVGNYPPISPRNTDGKNGRDGKEAEFGSKMIWQFLGNGRRSSQSGVRRLDAALDEARRDVVPLQRRKSSASLHQGRWAATQADGPTPRLNKAASSRRTPNWLKLASHSKIGSDPEALKQAIPYHSSQSNLSSPPYSSSLPFPRYSSYLSFLPIGVLRRNRRIIPRSPKTQS